MKELYLDIKITLKNGIEYSFTRIKPTPRTIEENINYFTNKNKEIDDKESIKRIYNEDYQNKLKKGELTYFLFKESILEFIGNSKSEEYPIGNRVVFSMQWKDIVATQLFIKDDRGEQLWK